MDISIPNTTAQQIGHKAFVMMGTRNKTAADERTLLFDVRGSKKVNFIRIRLDPSDTYTVEFLKNWPPKVVSTHSDIYYDALHDLIERVTGLHLSL